jgi:hypothetical protein
MIRWYQRWKLGRTLGKYVSPEVVNRILDEPGMTDPAPRFTERDLDWALVTVKFGEVEAVLKRIEIVCEDATTFQGEIWNLVNSMVMISFGGALEATAEERKEKRLRYVRELQAKLGKNVKIVHGSARAAIGLVGNESRSSFTFLIPNWSEALAMLGVVEFGEVREIQTKMG